MFRGPHAAEIADKGFRSVGDHLDKTSEPALLAVNAQINSLLTCAVLTLYSFKLCSDRKGFAETPAG